MTGVEVEVVRGKLPAGVGVQGARFDDGHVIVVVDRRVVRGRRAEQLAVARLVAALGGRPS